MSKLKWALRATTVCCLVIPLLVAYAVYSDNLMGLIFPPQLEQLINNANSNGSQNNSGNDINSTLAQLGLNPDKLQAPQIEQFTYNKQTGVVDLTMNFTNPMFDKPLDVSSFSVNVADSNGTQLFTIHLDKPINIEAGQTGDINLTGTALNDNAKAVMDSIINGGGIQNIDPNDFQLSNLTANVAGVTIHIQNVNSQDVLSGLLGGS